MHHQTTTIFIIMNSKFFIALFAILVFSLNTLAHNNETIVFSNIENTENGCVKEYLFCDKDTNEPLSKTVYIYDTEGRILEKTFLEWNKTQGWISTKKYEYNYTTNNQPSTPSLKKWDNKNNKWID